MQNFNPGLSVPPGIGVPARPPLGSSTLGPAPSLTRPPLGSSTFGPAPSLTRPPLGSSTFGPAPSLTRPPLGSSTLGPAPSLTRPPLGSSTLGPAPSLTRPPLGSSTLGPAPSLTRPPLGSSTFGPAPSLTRPPLGSSTLGPAPSLNQLNPLSLLNPLSPSKSFNPLTQTVPISQLESPAYDPFSLSFSGRVRPSIPYSKDITEVHSSQYELAIHTLENRLNGLQINSDTFSNQSEIIKLQLDIAKLGYARSELTNQMNFQGAWMNIYSNKYEQLLLLQRLNEYLKQIFESFWLEWKKVTPTYNRNGSPLSHGSPSSLGLPDEITLARDKLREFVLKNKTVVDQHVKSNWIITSSGNNLRRPLVENFLAEMDSIVLKINPDVYRKSMDKMFRYNEQMKNPSLNQYKKAKINLKKAKNASCVIRMTNKYRPELEKVIKSDIQICVDAVSAAAKVEVDINNKKIVDLNSKIASIEDKHKRTINVIESIQLSIIVDQVNLSIRDLMISNAIMNKLSQSDIDGLRIAYDSLHHIITEKEATILSYNNILKWKTNLNIYGTGNVGVAEILPVDIISSEDEIPSINGNYVLVPEWLIETGTPQAIHQHEEEHEKQECSVWCGSKCGKNEILSCGHPLCRDCASHLHKPECPVCRAPILSAPQTKGMEERQRRDQEIASIIGEIVTALVQRIRDSNALWNSLLEVNSNYNELSRDLELVVRDTYTDDQLMERDNRNNLITDLFRRSNASLNQKREIMKVDTEDAMRERMTGLVLEDLIRQFNHLRVYYDQYLIDNVGQDQQKLSLISFKNLLSVIRNKVREDYSLNLMIRRGTYNFFDLGNNENVIQAAVEGVSHDDNISVVVSQVLIGTI